MHIPIDSVRGIPTTLCQKFRGSFGVDLQDTHNLVDQRLLLRRTRSWHGEVDVSRRCVGMICLRSRLQ